MSPRIVENLRAVCPSADYFDGLIGAVLNNVPDRVEAEFVIKHLPPLLVNPYEGRKLLSDGSGLTRYWRAGSYRVLYHVDSQGIPVVESIGHRREVFGKGRRN